MQYNDLYTKHTSRRSVSVQSSVFTMSGDYLDSTINFCQCNHCKQWRNAFKPNKAMLDGRYLESAVLETDALTYATKKEKNFDFLYCHHCCAGEYLIFSKQTSSRPVSSPVQSSAQSQPAGLESPPSHPKKIPNLDRDPVRFIQIQPLLFIPR